MGGDKERVEGEGSRELCGSDSSYRFFLFFVFCFLFFVFCFLFFVCFFVFVFYWLLKSNVG